MVTRPPEKLGSFYLGAEYDLKNKSITDEFVNYDSRDLTTHAVCVGMTGSGKTGLCIGLLEEAAIDKIPAIIIDPKGDMTNLLLQFPELKPEDFEKWVNPDDAGRKDMTLQEYAAATAEKWKAGLADWGQDTSRIWTLQESVDYTIYTPGSTAGVPVNILGSFAAPDVDFEEDGEMITERIQGTVTALLGLIDSKADPVKSQEGILLYKIFDFFWRKKRDLDLPAIIHSIQDPPIQISGVFSIDTAFPKKERFELAMAFNNLLASPKFNYWFQGDSLDIEQMYFNPDGQPRHSIFYIAHLSESERMFFVTLLLNSFVTWMRKQAGTTSLRSLLYFDEIFGYFPPTSEPPSKKPLLTILKQARAYGVGTVMVTQNPVDIDYKGLSNAGTWFIGKLQTERDKDRVLEGLKGAIAEAGTSTEKDFDEIISSLSSRVFLMHNVHDTEPTLFHTRWAMSYLCGPLTRPQVKTLMADKKSSAHREFKTTNVTQAAATATAKKPAVLDTPNTTTERPSVSPSVDHRYLNIQKTKVIAEMELETDALSIVYEPRLLSVGKVRFYDAKSEIDLMKELSILSDAPDEFGRTDWSAGRNVIKWGHMLEVRPRVPEGVPVYYTIPPDCLNTPKQVATLRKDFSNWIYQTQREMSLEHKELTRYKTPEESETAFRMRVEQEAREQRDEELDALQDRYEAKFDRINDRIRKQEHKLDAALEEAEDRKSAEWLGVAETIFSVFVKKRSRSMSSIASKSRLRRKAKQKAEAAEEDLEDLRLDYERLEDELKKKLDDIRRKWDKISLGITVKEVKPRRTDIKIFSIVLVWHPYWITDSGKRVSALGPGEIG